MDNFDKIAQFKNYFPCFNFSEIRNFYNKTIRLMHQFHKRKKDEIKRLAQYSFRFLDLYDLLRKKNHRRTKAIHLERSSVTNIENSENLQNSDFKSLILTQKIHFSKFSLGVNRKKKLSLTDLVSQIIRIQKDKKERWKWSNRIKEMLKKMKLFFIK